MNEFVSIIIYIMPAILIVAAIYDVSTMKIPNQFSILLIVVYFFAALLFNLPFSVVVTSTLLALAGLLVGLGMFALNWLGGGDAKLMAATLLWLGVPSLTPFILYTALAGGGFCLLLMTARSHLPFFAQTGPGWVMRLMQPKGDIPYGVAIAIGALLAYPSSPLMTAYIAG